MATTDQAASFDQATVEVMINNLKGIVEAWQSDSQQQARQRQNLQDQLNAQYLRFVEDQHTLVMRNADANSLVANRIANDQASLSTLILSGEVDTTAQGAMGAKLAEEFRSVAKQAVEAAVAAVPGTSAAAQGTTGVAQGALQAQVPAELAQIILNNNSVQTALLTQLAKLSAVVDVLVVKVLGDEAVTVA